MIISLPYRMFLTCEEYLLAKVQEVHRKGSLVQPALLSAMIPISSSPATLAPVSSITFPIREKFYEMAGYPTFVRPSTAPAPTFLETPTNVSGRTTPSSAMPADSHDGDSVSNFAAESETTPRIQQQQPRPQRVHRVSLNNDLVAAHYNLPWTEEEKRRLEELLVIYPEEEVCARRYAKIAEALGTRTTTQVTNRIHKINAKKLRQAKKEAELARHEASRLLKSINKNSDILEDDEFDLEIDEEAKATEDYQEYLKLKRQLDEIRAQTLEHPGYKCDGCGMEPIVGARYHCDVCQNPEIDVCTACYNSKFSNAVHTASHELSLVTQVEAVEAEAADLMMEE